MGNLRQIRTLAGRHLGPALRYLRGGPQEFLLSRVRRGVIHVGANDGQEYPLYADRGLRVLWIEPASEAYQRLLKRIAPYANQRALQALITDVDGNEYTFHVANDGGHSSSLFPLGLHKTLWPWISYEKEMQIVSTTLPTLMRSASVNPADYDALVIDVQGAEMLVLRGAESLLAGISLIHVETVDFESYEGGATLSEVKSFLQGRGFRIRRKDTIARNSYGRYYDLLFAR